jgi:5-methylcytosine-specific restriction endonuclease McrA
VFESWSSAKQRADLDPDARPNARISKEELLDDINSVADDLGRTPASGEYNESGDYSLDTVYRRFDSWDEALEAAGLEVLNFRSITQRIGESELLKTLKEDIEEIGHVPTRDEYNERGTYTDTTFQNYFGGWNDALRQAGFEVNKEQDTRVEVECAGCGTKMQEPRWKRESRDLLFCSQECHKHAESFTEICANCGDETKTTHMNSVREVNVFCDDDCRQEYYLDHVANAKKRHCSNCGKEIDVSHAKTAKQNVFFCSQGCSAESRSISTEELVEDYKNMYNKLGRHPTVNDITEVGEHGLCTFYKSFDSLEQVADRAGIPRNVRTSKQVICENCGSEFARPLSLATNGRNFCDQKCYFEWMREGNLRDESIQRPPNYGPNWPSQRKKAVKRDNHTCQSCGMSSQEHKEECGVDLHVHHIMPWHKFDNHEKRNKLSNLVTLCASCHHKWEKIPVRPEIMGGES